MPGPIDLDRHVAPLLICRDPACEGHRLSELAHFDLHNRPCASLSIGHDGTELICELPAGHDGPHRGVTRRAEAP